MAMRLMSSRPCAVGVLPRGLCRPSLLRRAQVYQRPRSACFASEAPAVAKDDRIPVTVITGFLGSGKTTLLNHLLTRDHGKRIAVIENEFGEIDIDSQLVVRQDVLEGTKDTITQLSNGCLCCTVRDDLVKVLISLHARRQDFDHIVIETTGLANPAPIISTFFMDESLPDMVRLDGVVTVVDAKHVERHLDEPKKANVVNEAVDQIAYADRIILNKTDLSDEPSLRDLETRIRAINKMATVQRASRAVVDVDYVLGVGGFDLNTVEKQLATVMKEHDHEHDHGHDHEHHDHGPECSPDCTHESHKHDHGHTHSHGGDSHAAHSHDSHKHEGGGHDHGHSKHAHGPTSAAAGAVKVHDDRVTSVSLRLDGEMDLDRVNVMIGGLLSHRQEDMYRMKGILAIQNSDWRYIYQGVHSMFEGKPDRKWLPDEKRDCKMVFIGRDLDSAVFEEAFTKCLAKPTAVPAAV